MERDGVERPGIPEMDMHAAAAEQEMQAAATEEEPHTSALWDWSDLLDFTSDDHFNLHLEADQVVFNPQSELQSQPDPQPVNNSERVRKRDPRLTCSNFLAGRIPCACPEIDEQLKEEEASLPGKKRARTARAVSGQARCQVPGCEADISELKGYHKRHRVCLRCANAAYVLLDGGKKRYCQQCGKFHELPDFDEGKRSCRRKLERHNRRRRKPLDSKGAVEAELPGASRSEDLSYDGEAGNDVVYLSSKMTDQEAFFESEDGRVSNLELAANSQNVNSDSGVSFVASGEIHMDGGKDDSKLSVSPSYYDNKTYSSKCPTGRISFKLYDWNPAEFPRRLRHQIFDWLANMPVELEGYIRPGCTILTVFIAMPTIMWQKLYEDPIAYVHDFVIDPRRMLSGRGSMFVHLNNMIFHVKDGTSVMKVNMRMRSPRLHYVHPTCFEAGKPMEFVACGSNLLQSKLRFLISFDGKYLPHNYCIASPGGESKSDPLTYGHQVYKICVPHTEPHLFGPAFIEVENESGLSNFIPILIGEKEICCEIEKIQNRFETSFFPERPQSAVSSSLSDMCEDSALRHKALSELLVDIAWLLKVPAPESFQQFMTSFQVQRVSSLFSFLICNESAAILDKLLKNLRIMMHNMELNSAVSGINDTDTGQLLKYIEHARDILHQKLQKGRGLVQNTLANRSSGCEISFKGNLLGPITNQDLDTRPNGKLGMVVGSAAVDWCESETVPLLDREVVLDVECIKGWPTRSCGKIFSGRVSSSRPTISVIVIAAVCFAVCVVVLHPRKVGDFATSIRRSLFGNL